jgi:hypothetical protein
VAGGRRGEARFRAVTARLDFGLGIKSKLDTGINLDGLRKLVVSIELIVPPGGQIPS